jgi:hypothetical protein
MRALEKAPYILHILCPHEVERTRIRGFETGRLQSIWTKRDKFKLAISFQFRTAEF